MKSVPFVRNIFVLFLLFAFILGIVFCLSDPNKLFSQEKEGLVILQDDTTNSRGQDTSCPNVLVRQGGSLLLYNTLLPESESNPIPFYNLDEYVLYVKSQRENGIRCPVLYLQQENNTQGENVYRMRTSPFSIEGGLPPKILNPIIPENASLDNPPYNQGQYSGFDPYSQYIGQYTVLDKIHDSTRQVPISDNPMDTNWGGVIHSQQQVDSGKYDENTVGKPLMVPKVLAIQP